MTSSSPSPCLTCLLLAGLACAWGVSAEVVSGSLSPSPNPARAVMAASADQALSLTAALPSSLAKPRLGGTRISLTLPIPPQGESRRVDASIKIYDIVGNLVQSGRQENILDQVPDYQSPPGGECALNLFWRGQNDKGLPVAPGVYRAVIYLDYESQACPDRRLAADIGISW